MNAAKQEVLEFMFLQPHWECCHQLLAYVINLIYLVLSHQKVLLFSPCEALGLGGHYVSMEKHSWSCRYFAS